MVGRRSKDVDQETNRSECRAASAMANGHPSAEELDEQVPPPHSTAKASISLADPVQQASSADFIRPS